MPDDLPILTNARQALWAALDAWPALKKSPDDPTATVFVQRFTFDDEMFPFEDLEPSISDFPCIAIAPATLNMPWYLNRMQNWQVAFQITIWAVDWYLKDIERIVQDISESFFRATDPLTSSSVPIVKAACGFYPQQIGPVVFAPVKVGSDRETRAIRCQMTVVIRNNNDPLSVVQ
jgi:hypothetical protein